MPFNHSYSELKVNIFGFRTFSIDVNVNFAILIPCHILARIFHLMWTGYLDIRKCWSRWFLCTVMFPNGYACIFEEHHGKGLCTVQIQSHIFAFLYHDVHQLLQLCRCFGHDYCVVCWSHYPLFWFHPFSKCFNEQFCTLGKYIYGESTHSERTPFLMLIN